MTLRRAFNCTRCGKPCNVGIHVGIDPLRNVMRDVITDGMRAWLGRPVEKPFICDDYLAQQHNNKSSIRDCSGEGMTGRENEKVACRTVVLCHACIYYHSAVDENGLTGVSAWGRCARIKRAPRFEPFPLPPMHMDDGCTCGKLRKNMEKEHGT